MCYPFSWYSIEFCTRSCSIGSHLDYSAIGPRELPLSGSPIRCDGPLNAKPHSVRKRTVSIIRFNTLHHFAASDWYLASNIESTPFMDDRRVPSSLHAMQHSLLPLLFSCSRTQTHSLRHFVLAVPHPGNARANQWCANTFYTAVHLTPKKYIFITFLH